MLRIFFSTLCATCLPAFAMGGMPGTCGIPPLLLAGRLEEWRKGDATLKPAVEALLRDADKALSAKPLSVMQKRLTPSSGDRHDYFSFGIYWWPDPSKPDGLPYIRKDGRVNPESRDGNDAIPFGRTNRGISDLALAYYFTGKEAYAAKAAELARVWYLAPEMRMNPNMNHAQAIPGRNDGRGIGIIEGSTLTDLMDGIALIRPSEAWTDEDDAAMTKWLADFHQWLTTGENGREQEKEPNNHGTHYDVLATHLALYLGKKDEAKERSEKALARRVDTQIKPDGKQPLELRRTISFSYTVFNLGAFFELATLGEATGVDFWNTGGRRVRV